MKNEELDIIIEKSLKTSQGFLLPADFAQKVTRTIVRREQWKTDLREYLLMTGIILALLSIAAGLYYYVDKAFINKAFSFVTTNTLQAIGILFVLNFVLLADRVLLPLLFNKWSSK